MARLVMAVVIGPLAAAAADGQTAGGKTPGGKTAGGQTPGALLGPRHTDTLNGFSIRRPAGSRVERKPSVTELTRFNVRDAKTGAIRISMRLLRGAARKKDRQKEVIDLRTYATTLAKQLQAGQDFKIETGKTRLLAVAGKQAVSFQGPFGLGRSRVYCRDVWVHTTPNRFLVVRTIGPLNAAAEIVRISDASVGTLKLFDATAARKKHKAHLARGGKVLASITRASLGAAVAKRGYWLMIQQGGKWVGFCHVVEKSASRERTDGVLVLSEFVLAPAGGAQVFRRRDMYAAFDRTVEKWETYTLRIDTDGKQTSHTELGMKQNEVLLVQTVLGRATTKDYSRKIPLQGSYVPQAMERLLGRLIDRREGGAYAFGQYNSATRDFDMRTISVIGPTRVDVGGRMYDAVLLHDQMAIDAPATKVYLDAAGLPLKVVSEDGAVLQQTTAAAVKARFPAAWKRFWPAGGPAS